MKHDFTLLNEGSKSISRIGATLYLLVGDWWKNTPTFLTSHEQEFISVCWKQNNILQFHWQKLKRFFCKVGKTTKPFCIMAK
jgi:hypothetical protein